MKKPIEPVRCVCGRRVTAFEIEVRDRKVAYGVRCRVVCWLGPIRATRGAAVRAWNRVMNAAREVNRG